MSNNNNVTMKTLVDKQGNVVVPVTHIEAVFDSQGNSLPEYLASRYPDESKPAEEDGLDLSLVTTGEKYEWNDKYDKPSTGIPSSDLSSDVLSSLGKADAAIPNTEKGANGGVATLDNTGKVPSSQLPSYVDDVIEGYYYGTEDPETHEIVYNFYSDASHTELITPESGKIYVDLTSGKTYRWGGSTYVEISASEVTGIKVGQSGSVINPSSGIVTIPDYEVGAQVHRAPTEAEVKSALGTGSGTSKYLREDGQWTIPLVYTQGKGIDITNDVISIDNTVQVVTTLSLAPSNSTLTYTIGQTLYNFKVGDEVRVPNSNVPTGNHGYVYYKLFDLVTIELTTTAFWCMIGSGSSEGGSFYTPTLSSEPTESTLSYTKDGQTLAFEIGQFCRVADANAPLGYKFYQLYDLAQNGTVAKWNAQAVKITPSYTAPTALLTTPIYNGSPQPILEGGSSGDGEIQYSLDGVLWLNEIPYVTDAGEYTVYWRLIGDGVHSDIPATEITVTVEPKVLDNPDILLSIDEYTYNGEACTPVVTIKDGDDVLTSDLYIVTYSDNTNAGTATVTVTDSGKNYSFSVSTTFTIDKANGTVTTAPVNRASTYNSNALPVADVGAGTGTMMYRIGDTGDFSATMPTATNADTYTLYYYAAESANYLLSATEYIQVTIVKANPTYSSPTAKTLTYTGSSQDLLNAGSTSDGTIQYSSDGGSTWSSSIPQGIDAGDYTPQWKLVGDSNHNDVSATTINVTIAKAAPSYTTPTGISGLIYDATAQDLLNAGTTSDGTISYSDDNETWSSTIPKGTNADTYSVYWKLDGDSNHIDIASTIINVNIAKVTPTVTAPTAKTLTYNTQSQELLNAGSTNWGTLKYSNDGTNYETTIPAETNAGTYTLYYKVEGDSNINNVAPVEISATIAKVTPTVTAPTVKTGLVYSSLAQDLINAGSTDYGTLLYSLDDITYSTSIPQGIIAGSYSVYYRVIGDSNINDVAATSVLVSIAKVTPTVVAPIPKVLTFDGTAQELIEEGSVNFGTLQYKVGADSWSTSIPTRINGGSYELLYRVVGDSNINNVAPDSIVCSISEKSITATVELSQNSYTYDGTEKEPTVTVKDGSTVIDPSEYSVSYSNNINAGTATVTIYDNTGGDYDVVGSATFTITKAAGSVTTAPTAKSLKYNTAAQTLANAGSGTGTIYYSLSENSDFSTTIPTGTNVGSYTVYYYAAESANYLQSATSSISVTIGKGDGSVSTAPTAKTLTYNGSALTLANAGSGTGTMYYSLNSSSGFSTTIPTGTDAGSYTVYYYAAESGSYNQSATGNISVSIGKADPTYTAPTAKSLTYSGSAQALLNAGSTSHGTIQYSSNNSSWGTTIPTGTNANTYTSYWRIVGDSNHKDKASASISTTIGKANQNAPTATGATTTYSTTATASASGGGGQGSIEWSNGNTQTSVGSKTTQARWSGNNNYNASGWSNSVTLTMNKASGSVTTAPTNRGVTYNGSNLNLVNAGSGTGTMYYRLNSGSWSTSIPQASTAGSYTVYYYAAASTNYNLSSTGSLTATIGKANRTLSWSTAPSSINIGSSSSVAASPSAGSGDGAITYSSSDSNIVSVSGSTITGLGTGSCTIYASIAAGTNYNSASTSYSITVNTANGVYAIYSNGSLRTAAKADSSAIGVAVRSSSRNFIIDKNNLSYSSGMINDDGENVITTLTNNPSSDYSGFGNTVALYNAAASVMIHDINRKSITINSDTKKGYVGGGGEMYLYYSNKSSISSVLSAIGSSITTYAAVTCWTSTLTPSLSKSLSKKPKPPGGGVEFYVINLSNGTFSSASGIDVYSAIIMFTY